MLRKNYLITIPKSTNYPVHIEFERMAEIGWRILTRGTRRRSAPSSSTSCSVVAGGLVIVVD